MNKITKTQFRQLVRECIKEVLSEARDSKKAIIKSVNSIKSIPGFKKMTLPSSDGPQVVIKSNDGSIEIICDFVAVHDKTGNKKQDRSFYVIGSTNYKKPGKDKQTFDTYGEGGDASFYWDDYSAGKANDIIAREIKKAQSKLVKK